jgi:hypothetical protein
MGCRELAVHQPLVSYTIINKTFVVLGKLNFVWIIPRHMPTKEKNAGY